MGNSDGIMSGIASMGSNTVITINEKAYFSFAHGDEIALVLGDYYILNCEAELWYKVQEKVKETKSLKKIKKWWIKQSKKYQVSYWSGSFDDLKEV